MGLRIQSEWEIAKLEMSLLAETYGLPDPDED
jgi:hypothetical protein